MGNGNLNMRVLIILICLSASFSVYSNSKEINIKQADNWITEHTFERDSEHSKEEVDYGGVYLLVDFQYNAITHEQYKHIVIEIINETGIQNYSDLWVDYEPTFQKLNFHKIQLHRNSIVHNKLQKDNISVIQNETELERRIYNGTFSAGLFIEDVQAGDIIEFSFTIAGENPVLDGYAFNSLLLQYWSPVRKLPNSFLFKVLMCPESATDFLTPSPPAPLDSIATNGDTISVRASNNFFIRITPI